MNRAALLLALGLLLFTTVAADQDDGWVSLFDGKKLTGWVTLDRKPVAAGWEAADGVLHNTGKGADIYTPGDYANFILEWEWKIGAGGNSGVKYRMAMYDKQYLGPEYQLFDDTSDEAAKSRPDQLTGSLYELFAPSKDKVLKPLGEWNTSRLVCQGTKIEHWLNGVKVVEADTSTPAFKEAVAKSKFKKWPDYGSSPAGRLMLQGHGTEVWFRGIRVKVLP